MLFLISAMSFRIWVRTANNWRIPRLGGKPGPGAGGARLRQYEESISVLYRYRTALAKSADSSYWKICYITERVGKAPPTSSLVQRGITLCMCTLNVSSSRKDSRVR